MQTQIHTKDIRYIRNSKGEDVEAVLNLKNRAIKVLFEDIVDLLSVQDRMTDERVDFFKAADEILAKRKK